MFRIGFPSSLVIRNLNMWHACVMGLTPHATVYVNQPQCMCVGTVPFLSF